MMSFSKFAPFRCRLAALCAVIVAGGCSAKPELRIPSESGSALANVEGKHLLEQGRAVDAVAAFRRQLRLEGADLQSLNGLAIAYGELGQTDLAAEMFSRALAMAPDDPATLNNIGFAALRRADARLARHYLEKARARSDELQEIEGNLERLALLETFERRPRSGFLLARAGPASPAERSSSVRPIALAGIEVRQAPSAPLPMARPPRSPPDTIIDFTAVIDPFAQGHEMK